jgi:hypothetical protein
MVAAAIAASGKLAVVVGAWSASKKATPSAQSGAPRAWKVDPAA